MKVKDLIAALTNCPMHDEIKVRVVINNEGFDAEIDGTKRDNSDSRPHSVITCSLVVMTKVELEVE